MTFPELYILRHGQTEWNAAGRLQGHLDSPLTELGRAQAARQRDILANRDLTGFDRFVSPLGRTLATADIIAPKGDWRADERLMEITLGSWDGQKSQDVAARHPEMFDIHTSFSIYDAAPDGEGTQALFARVGGFLSELTGPAILVTHGITSRMLRCHLLGKPAEAFTELPGGQGVVYHVRNGKCNLLQ